MAANYLLLENSFHLKLQNNADALLLEQGGILKLYPDAFQATAIIKVPNPFASTANWRVAQP